MAKKTIAVDIDEVLAHSAQSFVEYSNQKWGTNLSVEDYDEDWAKVWGLEYSDSEVVKRAEMMHDPERIRTIPFNEDALGVLEELKADFRLVVLTSRRSSILTETTEWIEAYFNDVFEEILLSGIWDSELADADFEHNHKLTKAEVALKNNIDYLIDDQVKHVVGAAEAGIPSLLFGNYEWNKISDSHGLVTRVHTWEEVRQYFERELQK